MGCGASTSYSQISPELHANQEDALYASAASEVDALAWQANVLTKPSLAREATYSYSPKEALALDLFLLSSNLLISKNVSLEATQNIFQAVPVSYSIKDAKELKAGAVSGHGETYLEQRRDLIASMYREVKYRLDQAAATNSSSSSSGAGAGHGTTTTSTSSSTGKSHSSITRGFLTSVSSLFGGHGGHGEHACHPASMAPNTYIFSPQEGAGVLQAGQVLIDLFHGYHPRKAADADHENGDDLQEQEPLVPRTDMLSACSSPSIKNSPSSKHSPAGSPSGSRGGMGGALPSSPNPKSQLSKVAAFALSAERALLISDLYLGQLRAVLLQYCQSLTSPALSQRQASATSPMSLALGALRQTDTVLVFVYTIAKTYHKNGGFDVLLVSNICRNLWMQCVGHVCGTMNMLCNFFLHHFLNTGPEHKFNNNKYTLLSLLANALPLMLSIFQHLAPCVMSCELARGHSTAPSDDLELRIATQVLQRAYWAGCACMLELAQTVKIAVGVLGAIQKQQQSSAGYVALSSSSATVSAESATDQPPSPGKSAHGVVLSAGQQMLVTLQGLLTITSPIGSPLSLFEMTANLVDVASGYFINIVAKEKAFIATSAEEEAVLARNEKVMLDSIRTYGVSISAALDAVGSGISAAAVSDSDTRSVSVHRTPDKFRSPSVLEAFSPETNSAILVRQQVDQVTSTVTALNLMLRTGHIGASQEEVGHALLHLLDSSALSILKPEGGDATVIKALLELAPALAELFCATGARENKQGAYSSLSQNVVFKLSKRLAGFVDLIRTVLRQRSCYAAAANGGSNYSADTGISNHGILSYSSGNAHNNNKVTYSTKTQYTGNSSDKVIAVPEKPEEEFSVGDKVDGLCKLANDSERWFTGRITDTTLIPSPYGEGAMKWVYTLAYEDGDIHVNKSATEIRKTKKRASRRSVGIPATTADTGFTARALEASAAQEREKEKEKVAIGGESAVVAVAVDTKLANNSSDKENQYRNNVLSVEDEPALLRNKANPQENPVDSAKPALTLSKPPLAIPPVTVSPVTIGTDISAPATLSTLDPSKDSHSHDANPQHSAHESDAGSDNEDNGFFIIPSVFDDDDDILVGQQRNSSKQLVPKMEFDMSVLLSQSIQSVTSLSSLLTADRDGATGRHSINGSNVNTYRSTHLDSFRYPNNNTRDRSESMTALDSYEYHPTGPSHGALRNVQSSGALSSMASGGASVNDIRANNNSLSIGVLSLANSANSPTRSGGAASTFLSRQNTHPPHTAAQAGQLGGRDGSSPPRGVQFPVLEDLSGKYGEDDRSTKEGQYGSIDVPPSLGESNRNGDKAVVAPEYLLEPLDEHTLHTLVRTYTLVAAALLPCCVQDERLHGSYTCLVNESSLAGAGAGAGASMDKQGSSQEQAVNVAYSVRELFEILNVASISDTATTLASVLPPAPVVASEITPVTKLMRTAFETAMLRSAAPGSGARRLMQLCGLSLSSEPVMAIPCLTSHLSGNDSNVSNVSLGKGGFADVSLVICPVDCPCNPNASRLSEYCTLLGIDVVNTSGALGHRNQSLLDVAKQRLAKRYAVKRLRRERSSAEDPPLIHSIYNEITCLELLRDANTVGVCKLFGFGVTEVEYLLPMDVGGKNLSDWRNELSSDLIFQAVCDVLRRGKFNKNMPVGWPVSICIHNNSTVVSSQLLPFATATVDEEAVAGEYKDASSPTAKASSIPDPTAPELDTILSLLLLEIYWDICLIVRNVHKCDIAHYDLKCGNFMFRHDLVVEEESRASQEHRQRQLIQAEEDELVRIAQQSAEAAVLASKLKKQWEYSTKLEAHRVEVTTHCTAETERRTKNNDQLTMLKEKMKKGKNPKVKAAYAVDIEALTKKLKTERAERKVQEESLAAMQVEYDSLKSDADACEMRHTEANKHRHSARSATRAALEMDNSENADEASRARDAHQQQLRLLVSLLRSLPYMRACHVRGEASGMILLFDFGESVPYASSGIPAHVSAHERRCRGTLPVQAPEFLSITSGVSASAAGNSNSVPISARNSSPQTPATSSRAPTPAGASSSATAQTCSAKRTPIQFSEPCLPADIWSLGCLLPELVTGSFLFADMPWTEMYVSLCTVPSANAAGVITYDIDGDVDTSKAPEPNIDLFTTLGILSGGEGGLFSQKYPLDANKARPPAFASANLNAAVTAVETVMRQALRRLPSSRPNASGICKLIGTALKEVAFSKGDAKGYQNVVLPEQQRILELPKIAPCSTLSTSAGSLFVGTQCSFSLSNRSLCDFAGLVDPAPPHGVSSVSHLSAWLGRYSLQAAIDTNMHVVCFTTRPHYDLTVRAAVGLVHDISVASNGDNLTDSRGHHPGFDTDTDSELMANYVHTAFPVHALHDHTVVDLDTTNTQVMRQWSDLHEEWLHRFDVWEEADQACLDDPVGHIIDQGGRIVGVFIGGHLAATVAMKPMGSPVNNKWELIKLAVHPLHTRQGLGKLLLHWVIDTLCASIKKKGGVRGTLYLESNTKLVAAISLYNSNSFMVTHQRDLVAEAAQRAAEAIADAERIAEEQQAARSWRGASTKTVKQETEIVIEAPPSFPSPYETCDIIMERMLDVRNHKPLLSSDTGAGRHAVVPGESGNTKSSNNHMLSPRVAQSYSENASGGSLRFVHVAASEPGALEDVALAIRNIAQATKEHAVKHNMHKFTLLVDPISDKLSTTAGVGAAIGDDKREYDALCVAGAAALLESLGASSGLTIGTTVAGAGTSTTGAAHAIISSIRPHSHALESAINMLQELVED